MGTWEAIKRFFVVIISRFQKPVRIYKDKGRAADAEANGQWYLRRDLLDKLPEYMLITKKLRRIDRGSYNLYCKVGAVLVPPVVKQEVTISDNELVVCANDLPSFGAVAMLYNDVAPDTDPNLISLKFVYFQKLKHVPAGVAPSKGQVYHMGMYYAYAHHNRDALAQFYIAVHPDGTTTALRERHIEFQPLPRRKGREGRIPKVTHSLPHCLTHKISEYDHKSDDPQEAARMVFVRYMNTYYQGSNGVRVAVSKGRQTAIFTIDMLRSPYFFSDREPVIINGVQKRIFHYVKPHTRTYPNGTTTKIKSHFRGLSKFDWLGYKVSITVPGKTALDILTFDPAAYNAEDVGGLPGFINERQLAKELAPHVNEGSS